MGRSKVLAETDNVRDSLVRTVGCQHDPTLILNRVMIVELKVSASIRS